MIRNSAFDAAVANAREGIGGAYKLPPESSAQLIDMLGAALPDRHNLTLLPLPRPNGGCRLGFMVRLYGGPVEVFLLAEFEGSIAGLSRPILLLVDYANHQIERPMIEESETESARKNGSA